MTTSTNKLSYSYLVSVTYQRPKNEDHNHIPYKVINQSLDYLLQEHSQIFPCNHATTIILTINTAQILLVTQRYLNNYCHKILKDSRNRLHYIIHVQSEIPFKTLKQKIIAYLRDEQIFMFQTTLPSSKQFNIGCLFKINPKHSNHHLVIKELKDKLNLMVPMELVPRKFTIGNTTTRALTINFTIANSRKLVNGFYNILYIE